MKKFWNWLRNDADGESELYLDLSLIHISEPTRRS